MARPIEGVSLGRQVAILPAVSSGRIVAWPMYAVDEHAVALFWQGLRRAMRSAGLDDLPRELSRPRDLAAHWLHPDLLLSQTCGLPFTSFLRARVRYVCTPRFKAEGCDGAFYQSAVVVRHADPARSLADLRGRRAAFNSPGSHSGYNGFRGLLAPIAGGSPFFAAVVETGSHRASLAAVKAGDADVAAIDMQTLALVTRADPAETEGLRIIGRTAPAPGLPLITSLRTRDEDLARLRAACADACDPTHPAARALNLDGIAILPERDYDQISDVAARAAGLGYPELA